MLSSWHRPQSSGNKGRPGTLSSSGGAFPLWSQTSQRPETGDGPKKAQGTCGQEEEKVRSFNQKDDPTQQGTRAAQAAAAEPWRQSEGCISHHCGYDQGH